MKKYILPLIVIAAFYSESLFVEFFRAEAFDGERLLIPHFLLTTFILMGIYYFRNETLIYAGLFGFLFDVYYTGVLGVYLFLFPIAVYLATKLMRMLQSNLLMSGVIVMLIISFVEVLVWALSVLVLGAQMTVLEFLNKRLWPTLVLNLAFYIIVCVPLSKWLQQRKKEKLSEQ